MNRQLKTRRDRGKAKLHRVSLLAAGTAATLLFVVSLQGGAQDLSDRQASAGDLDPTFNFNGEKEIPISPNGQNVSHDQANGIAIQTDGKIVLAGWARADINSPSSPEQFALVRLNPDGSQDNSFGVSGIVTTQVSPSSFSPNSRVQAVLLQPDGKILTAGLAFVDAPLPHADWALARYDANGVLDTTFGTGGKVTGIFAGIMTANAVATSLLLQPDGKIVAGGFVQSLSAGSDFGLARFNSDGSLDPTFGTGGKLTTDWGSNGEQINGLAFQTDQSQLKIVAVGEFAGGPTNHEYAVARYLPNGSLDPSFGTAGKVVTFVPPSGGDAAAAAVQSDGKIVVTGAGPDVTMARFNRDGTIDSTFGSGGTVSTLMAGGAFPDAIAIQPDHKFLVSGAWGGCFVTVRYLADGSLDLGFGQPILGLNAAFTCFPPNVPPPINGANSFGMALDADNKIVLAGDAEVGSNHVVFGVARLLNDVSSTPAPVPFDFDGDRIADIAVVRPASGEAWFGLNSHDSSFWIVPFGLSADKLIPADYDGDGKADVAVFRNGVWWILRSTDSSVLAVSFGQSGDLPRPGDFDGDRKADFCIFRPASGDWWRLNSSNGQVSVVHWGQNGDVPMIGDFDGDGRADETVYRPGNAGWWYTLQSSNGQAKIDQFGASGDIALNGDFDGDGRSDLAVFRPSNTYWYIARATGIPGQNYDAIPFGLATDSLVPADYDGDGKTDVAIFRNGQWWIMRSSDAAVIVVDFGSEGDVPAESAYAP